MRRSLFLTVALFALPLTAATSAAGGDEARTDLDVARALGAGECRISQRMGRSFMCRT